MKDESIQHSAYVTRRHLALKRDKMYMLTGGAYMEITIGSYDLKTDDLDRTAWLFYVTDLGIMRMFFGREKQAVPLLKKLILLNYNHFSYNHIICARRNGEIVGILAGFDGKMNRLVEKECGQEYFRSLGFLKALRAGLVALFMQWLFRKSVADDEFYVNNLCVAPGNRSLGIGAALLGEIFKKYDKVGLGVNVNNHRGLKFYERNGFKVESGHKINILGKTIGAYNMIWNRKDNCCGSG